MSMAGPQVLIAGAGPTGLVLALWLAKANISVRLIDRKPGPGEGSRAIVIHARTLEFYRQLGIAADLIARAFRVDRLNLRSATRRVATISFEDVGKSESPYPFVVSYPQDAHERYLIDCLHALGVKVEWNTELTAVMQNQETAHAVLRKNGAEETWIGPYLCGCDGAHSAVRHSLNIGFPGGTYDQLFYVADALAQGEWSGHELTAFIAPKSFCLVVPVREQGMFRFIGLVPEALRAKTDVSFADLRAGVELQTATRITQINWFSTYRVHHRVAEQFRQGRVFLAGDAGHVHSPAGGQGMNTGIGDAVNLAWKLAAVLRGQSAASLLDSYEPERIPFAQSLVATTDRVFEFAVGRGMINELVRTYLIPYLLPLALRFAAVRRAQFRLVSQTRITYRDCDFNAGAAGSLRGGDRLPWVEALDNFAPLRSREWLVHVYGQPSPALGDFCSRRHIALHAWPWTKKAGQVGLRKDACYLVRPDGYIGFISRAQQVDELEAYLRPLSGDE